MPPGRTCSLGGGSVELLEGNLHQLVARRRAPVPEAVAGDEQRGALGVEDAGDGRRMGLEGEKRQRHARNASAVRPGRAVESMTPYPTS